MTGPISDPNERATSAPPTNALRDKRQPPRGVLPRQLQTWLMVAVAAVILIIIAITGHQAPPAKSGLPDRPSAPALAPTDRIRSFERQLTDDEIRLRQMAESGRSGQSRSADVPPPAVISRGPDPHQPTGEPSLSADNVAFSRRSVVASSAGRVEPPTAQASDAFAQALTSGLAALDPLMRTFAPTGTGRPGIPATPTAQPTPSPEPAASVAKPPVTSDENADSWLRCRLIEGTLIEAVLLNRLDGTFAGPVIGLVTIPVYSQNRQRVVIPAGARLLGSAAPVQAVGDTRLAVSFHRLVMPDGRTYSLDRFKGLSQVGETGLRDQVNRHYAQVFGASLAVGALSALAQLPTRSGFTTSFADTAGQGAGSSLATSSAHILDRYLNVLPTVTIREGYRLKVYLTNDLDLPAYVPASGGVR